MSLIPVFIYWKGRKVNRPNRISFEGDLRAIQIKRNIGYDFLKRKIHAKLKLMSNQIISSITCRYVLSQNPIMYAGLNVTDDEDVECMINAFEQQSSIRALELYVDVDTTGSSSMPTQPSLGLEGNSTNEPIKEMSVINLDEPEAFLEEDEDVNDEDEGEIPYGSSSDTDVEAPAMVVSPISSSVPINQYHQSVG